MHKKKKNKKQINKTNNPKSKLIFKNNNLIKIIKINNKINKNQKKKKK